MKIAVLKFPEFFLEKHKEGFTAGVACGEVPEMAATADLESEWRTMRVHGFEVKRQVGNTFVFNVMSIEQDTNRIAFDRRPYDPQDLKCVDCGCDYPKKTGELLFTNHNIWDIIRPTLSHNAVNNLCITCTAKRLLKAQLPIETLLKGTQ